MVSHEEIIKFSRVWYKLCVSLFSNVDTKNQIEIEIVKMNKTMLMEMEEWTMKKEKRKVTNFMMDEREKHSK